MSALTGFVISCSFPKALIHQLLSKTRNMQFIFNIKVSKNESKHVRKKFPSISFWASTFNGFQSDLSNPFHTEIMGDGGLSVSKTLSGFLF